MAAMFPRPLVPGPVQRAAVEAEFMVREGVGLLHAAWPEAAQLRMVLPVADPTFPLDVAVLGAQGEPFAHAQRLSILFDALDDREGSADDALEAIGTLTRVHTLLTAAGVAETTGMDWEYHCVPADPKWEFRAWDLPASEPGSPALQVTFTVSANPRPAARPRAAAGHPGGPPPVAASAAARERGRVLRLVTTYPRVCAALVQQVGTTEQEAEGTLRELESDGVVGPADSCGTREVLMTARQLEQLLRAILSGLTEGV